jgi:hypothetical protein
MKPITSLVTIVLSASLFVLTGCQTVSTSEIQYLGVKTYPPSNPADVQILRTTPTRPHVQLGEVRAEPSTESIGAPKIEAALQKVAAKLGADAVVIVSDKTQVVGAQAVGGYLNRDFEEIQGRVIIGVAIKYTK